MIINIDDDLFYKVVSIMKNRSASVYEELAKIKPIELSQKDTLIEARAVKTKRVKQSIQETIKSLCDEDMKPTKYQVHKRTNIAYVTINKYYDDILKEVIK